MPRTASSQVQSRSNTKARPSANVRAGNLVANTPVLFRLPAIPSAPAQDLAVTFSEAAASLPTATLAAVAIATTQPAVSASVAEPVSEVSVTPQATPQQTWWEHWSSGIVLIVLLIALATASILAWQGSSKGNSKLMADTKKEADSQSDLSNIAVPKLDTQKLDLPRVEMPVSTKTNSYVERLESPSAQNNTLSTSSDSDSSLIPNGSLSLTLDPPTNNEMKSEPEPYATASLNPPVVKPQEPLFKDSELTQSKTGLSAQPASTSTQRSATNSDKPALWDSSKTNLHDTSKPLTLEFSNDESNSISNSNTSTTDPTTESPTASAKLISQSSVDATDYIAPSTSGTLVPKGMQNAVKTVTPEMDQAQLFAAYRELKAPTGPAKVDNRYGNTSTAGSQTQTGPTSGTQASVVGYTQQQPIQTNSQPTQTSNNYTLQPAQNYAPNAAVPQYSATQTSTAQNSAQYSTQPYQNQQFQNPQYPTQQSSGQQNSGPQYSAQQNPALPQYSTQPQPGMQNPNSMQMQGLPNQPSTAAQGLQYGGAQVPYNTQPAQGQSLQLPAGPIGGYGTASTAPTNKPTAGTANLNSPTSPSYPSLR